MTYDIAHISLVVYSGSPLDFNIYELENPELALVSSVHDRQSSELMD